LLKTEIEEVKQRS